MTVQKLQRKFHRINAGLARVKLLKPTTTVLGVLTTTTNVDLAGNGLQVLKGTFFLPQKSGRSPDTPSGRGRAEARGR